MSLSFSSIPFVSTFMILLLLLVSPSRSSRTDPTTSASVPEQAILANNSSSLFLTPHVGKIFESTRVNDFQPTTLEILEQDNLRVKWLIAGFEYAQQNYNSSHDGLISGSELIIPQRDDEIDFDYMWAFVYSGYSIGNANQILRLEVGTPPQALDVIFDTGSSLTWVFCPECLMCGHEYGPAFEPSTSSSYKPIMCEDPMCHAVMNPRCGPDKTCLYWQVYGLGEAHTEGYLAKEKLTFAFSTVEMAIGCSSLYTVGNFTGVSGILGLSQGALSMIKQLQLKSFAYCLTSPGSDDKAMLSFNQDIPTGSDYISVGILQNRRNKSLYYLDIIGISLDDEELDIPAYLFQIDRRTGMGGIIIDSGTVVTRIPSEAYVILGDAVRQMIPHPLVGDDKEMDTCYNRDTIETFKLPSLAFNLPSDDLLYVRNYFMPTLNMSCLAIVPDDSAPMSIIGSSILQGIRMAYDLENLQVVFYPGSRC